MESNGRSLRVVWIVFSAYFISYIAICLLLKDQQFLWLLLKLLSIAISTFLLIKNKFPKGYALLIPVLFTGLYFLSTVFNFNVIGAVLGGGNVFLSTCAIISTHRSIIGEDFVWVRHEKKSDIIKSVLVGILVGVIWGGLNYLLMKGSNEVEFGNVTKALLVALNPAVSEEITDRAIFYAFCIYLMRGIPASGKAGFTCWFMMIVPHVLPHILLTSEGGFLNALVNFIVLMVLYSAIFGAVFAFLQRKRDVVSAMIAHGLVDAIRFTIFGLPF